MLNLFKEKVKLSDSRSTKQNKNSSRNNITSKHFPSAIREWNNSLYFFNKNSLNLIPSTSKLVINLIKSYFNLYNKHIEQKMRTKVLSNRLRKLSLNKIFTSSGGFKHTNNKVYVNLYVFNRQKVNYLLVLKKWYIKSFLLLINKSKQNVLVSYKNNLNVKLVNKLKFIRNKGIQAVIKVTKDKYSLIKGLNTVHLSDKYDVNKLKVFSDYTKGFYTNLIKKSLKKMRMYFYYKQLLLINKSKLNYNYLQYLKNQLEKVFNKNVEFNIINLKKFYLNSDILSESITTKLSKNRRKIIKYLNKLKNKVKIEKKRIFLGFKEENKSLLKIFSNKKVLQKHIINNLKYRDITGYKLEAKGRLSKRFTASRAIHKRTHKGGIYDIDSSYRNLSTVLLKGNIKPNTQYTYIKSKTRIGSFGIKGWISGN